MGKFKGKRNVTISVSITESQKMEMEELSAAWGVDMASIVRRLILLFISEKINLFELMKKYQLVHADKNDDVMLTSGSIKKRKDELKKHRISIRLTNDEMQKLNSMAYEGLYLPGQVAGILLELFLTGIIEKSDIW